LEQETTECKKGKLYDIGRISKYEKAGAALIETPAHTCRFAQSYSSWSCSPAELHYASDCLGKGINFLAFHQAKARKCHPAI